LLTLVILFLRCVLLCVLLQAKPVCPSHRLVQLGAF
jgi:hypothetical protein